MIRRYIEVDDDDNAGASLFGYFILLMLALAAIAFVLAAFVFAGALLGGWVAISNYTKSFIKNVKLERPTLAP